MPSNNVKIIVGLVVILGLVIYINYNSKKKSNGSSSIFTDEPVQNSGTVSVNEPVSMSQTTATEFNKKPMRKQSRMPPRRGSPEETEYEWETYFGNSNGIDNVQIRSTNGNFKPLDETDGKYAVYDQPMKKMKPMKRSANDDGSFDPDMYDPDNLLPQENDLNYFEVVDSQVSLKGRLLRPENPLGIDTVMQSKKFASHDLRPVPLCPKFGVSPWNNSSAEPDVNIKTMW